MALAQGLNNHHDDGAGLASKPLLDQTQYTQPALFALEWSLAQLWCSRGVVPNAVVGHSVGEIAAACVAGFMTMETGMELTVQRSRLMQVGAWRGMMVCHCRLTYRFAFPSSRYFSPR